MIPRLRLLVLFFWALWLSVVTTTNVTNALRVARALPQTFSFASSNFELVETTQVFARMAAKIEPEWLLDAGGDLVKRSYSEPHWSERAARSSVKEAGAAGRSAD